MAFEHGEKGGERLIDNARKTAGRRDRALRTIEQGQPIGAGLCLARPHHGPDVDRAGVTSQPDATMATADAGHMARLAELVDDLHQMVLRDAIGSRHFGNGANSLGPRAQVEQNAHRVIGMAGESHQDLSVYLRQNMHIVCIFCQQGIHIFRMNDWMRAMEAGRNITEAEIAALIPRFYDQVRADSLIGPVFAGAIDDWPPHLEKLMVFWSSVMLTSGRYKGNPMAAHMKHLATITPPMFDRWLTLWAQVTSETLPADIAAALQAKAERIAQSLKLALYFRLPPRDTPSMAAA